jgi:hypothetical protein
LENKHEVELSDEKLKVGQLSDKRLEQGCTMKDLRQNDYWMKDRVSS